MEDTPFTVVDYEIDDLSGQSGQDVIDAAQGVMMSVHPKSSVRLSKDKGVIKLSLGGQIGAMGVDGSGKYANKVVWHELIAGFTQEGKDSGKYKSDWWQRNARFGFRQFLKAYGFDDKNPPRLNDEFLLAISGKDFIANITKSEVRIRGEDGAYHGTGDFRNELTNFKKAVQVPVG